ncbi:type I-C CRISPR-associated protein Cas7/Csd2 [Aporhodopirellula aestuarii]|uniref:Type I-C CRISPR-associated protein Cas7/Csd2 n=1 Tax=Aporhodopirellula aestuarii TaxID=2950107 RepID=A0ABT0UC65_9BACT|nr:type I-C CRISPR-associated protein Cas7/Csd2 [Aporhodopirellula aestuarii]MCM2373931.1 type I-C CRISPR-associated protein Cas7/Csd2 [Aporhodopirellula aestuarii]
MDHRYDFVFLFDVTDGNPNGDPDAGNLPRVDPETGHGLVTDVCLKRKIRNFVANVKDETPPFEIYVKERAVLNNQHSRAYEALKLDASKAKRTEVDQCRDWMCQNFYDVRAFGAVMSTKVNCGQVRGPVQMAFSRSIDPIVSLEHSITRCAVATEKEAEKQDGDNRTMGRKFTVPYGLYRCHGFINPFFARQTGFGEDDLQLFWKSLQNMFELDRSASRGQMTPQALVVFQHDDTLGNAPAHQLQKRVSVVLRDATTPARSSDDYDVQIDEANLPAGISIHRMF